MKDSLRRKYIEARKKVSPARRNDATRFLVDKLDEMTKDHYYVMSYYPLSSEVNVSAFNLLLQQQGRLLLPKIEGGHIVPYIVSDVDSQLETSSHRFKEPGRECIKATKIDASIVPGILFDKRLGRIGYGKGHYDKLLSKEAIYSIGLCFKEQVFDGELPLEDHDIHMEALCIV